MSAKLLNVYVEEKQMGCMAGIFQMFGRCRLLPGRRLTWITHKKLSSSGRSVARDSNQREECTPSSPQIILEYNPRKSSDDFRGIAKDNTINGETRCLSVKTSIQQEVKKGNTLKHRDSPRPILPLDLNASIQVMRRLKEAPSNLSEVSRFSCDGREIRSSMSAKVRELPRFSLDSLRNSKFDQKSKEVGNRSPSLVAKLMGLEAMPDSVVPQDPFNGGDSEKNRVRSSLEASDTRISKQSESVYSQIERRVKDVGFQESNKDLRALKHILDTMQQQAKEQIETKKGNDQQDPRDFVSPIVIMKPGKSINELQGLSGLRKLRTNRKQTKDQEKRTEEISSPRKTRSSPRPQQSARERSAGPVKTSSPPRVQQRKVESEKKPRLPPIRRQPEKSLSPKIKNKSKRNQEQEMTAVNADARSDNCSMKGKQKTLRILHEQVSSTMVVPPEQPSPISVLDASFYHDDEELSPSPVKRISIALQDDESQTSSEYFATSLSKSSSEMDSSKLVNIRNLVQKLRHLSSTDDIESQEPVLDYVFEILGLLPEDISSETGKVHHMLMLDVVEEIMVQKLELLSHCPQSDLLVRARKIGGQFFLREVCSEMKRTIAERPRGANLDDEEEMCGKDLVGVERSGVALEIERLIFKDLVDEIFSGEANTSLLLQPRRRRRQLFT